MHCSTPLAKREAAIEDSLLVVLEVVAELFVAMDALAAAIVPADAAPRAFWVDATFRASTSVSTFTAKYSKLLVYYSCCYFIV